MLQFKALSTVFRELQAPELEAAQAEAARLKEELAQVKDKLEEVESLRAHEMMWVSKQTEKEWAMKQKIWRLERANKAITEQAEAAWKRVREVSDENSTLREKLCKRRRKGSADAAA